MRQSRNFRISNFRMTKLFEDLKIVETCNLKLET